MTDLDRRSFLSGILASFGVAVGSEVARGRAPALAQTSSGAPRRIDVHHHFAPPTWVAEVKARPSLQLITGAWTPERSIEDMDRGGVAAAMVSITIPGLEFGDLAVTRRVARACNEYGAKLVQDYPKRFGLLAAMPLPDVDATLQEITYTYDTLHADGIHLFTSYGDRWLGNPVFRPVMAELNRRRAVVHVHPTTANCCKNLNYAPGVAPAIMEFGTDTTRAIMGVTFSGDTALFPDIRFIWSHAGGTMPFLAGRIDGGSRAAKDRLPNGFLYEAKRFYYDLAGATNPGAIASLLQLVPSTQMLFGTDFLPNVSSSAVAQSLAALKLLNDADRRAIERENAIALFPRLKG